MTRFILCLTLAAVSGALAHWLLREQINFFDGGYQVLFEGAIASSTGYLVVWLLEKIGK